MPFIFVDHKRYLQVMENLIDNAVKFMGDQLNPKISIVAERDNNRVVCRVKDNGIETKYKDKIFGLFEKITQKSKGTGIGLALVKRIIEIHGDTYGLNPKGRAKGRTLYSPLHLAPVENC
jgi:two-component system, LuxR family, sensor kinase FixL